MSDSYLHPNTPSLPPEELARLAAETPVENLARHPEVGAVYLAASAIAIASYNSRIMTSPVEGVDAMHEPVVHELLRRFQDDRGRIRFPLLHPTSGRTVEEVVIAGDTVGNYHWQSREPRDDGKKVGYFSSFPRLNEQRPKD